MEVEQHYTFENGEPGGLILPKEEWDLVFHDIWVRENKGRIAKEDFLKDFKLTPVMLYIAHTSPPFKCERLIAHGVAQDVFPEGSELKEAGNDKKIDEMEEVDGKLVDKYKQLFDKFMKVVEDYKVGDDLGIPVWVIFPDEKEGGYSEAIDILKERIKEIKKHPPYARNPLMPSQELAAAIATSFDFKNYSLNQITSSNKHRVELKIRSEFKPTDYSKMKNIASYFGYSPHLSEEDGCWFIRFSYHSHGDYKPKFKKLVWD